jgi:hypothetical protein
VNRELEPVVREWEALLQDCRRFAYMARAIELQRNAVDRLMEFAESLLERKHDAQTRRAEDEANLLLGMLTMLNAVRSELLMFIALKEDRTAEAWDHLVVAQNDVGAAIRAAPQLASTERYVDMLLVHEQNLFPRQVFISPRMVVGRSQCTVCGSAYGECVHVAGRAYMGEFCARSITEVDRIEEISVVGDPADKRRRVVSVKADDGAHRDFLTWRSVAPE